MFGRRWRLFRLCGIPVALDASWLITLALPTFSIASLFPALMHDYFGDAAPTLPSSSYWLMGLIAAVAFFGCILLQQSSASIRIVVPTRPPPRKNHEPQARKRSFTMSTSTHVSEQSLRIGADELRNRLQSGEAVTLLDARGHRDWEASPDKIRGAIHTDPTHFHIDPSWPNDQLTVVY